MPSKTTKYPRVHYPQVVLESAFREFTESASRKYVELQIASGFTGTQPVDTARDDLTEYVAMSVHAGSDQWTFDTVHEFFEEYRKPHELAFIEFGIEYFHALSFGSKLQIHLQIKEFGWGTEVVIQHPVKSEVSRISSVFETAAPNFLAPEPTPPPVPKPRIFVGHGGKSGQWRDLKDHLSDVHGYEVIAFESGARAGNAVRDVLSGMLDASTFAILVMTAEDAQDDGTMRAAKTSFTRQYCFRAGWASLEQSSCLKRGQQTSQTSMASSTYPFRRGTSVKRSETFLARYAASFLRPRSLAVRPHREHTPHMLQAHSESRALAP